MRSITQYALASMVLLLLFGCHRSDPAGDSAEGQPAEPDAAGQTEQSEWASVPTAELIDSLVNLTSEHYAIRTNIIGFGEDGQGDNPLPEGLVMMQDPGPTPPDAVQELVRRGARAAPELVAHLGDTRTTKVPIPTLMGNGFGYEYDYNAMTTDPPPGVNLDSDEARNRSANLAWPEVYAVGDVCFDLLGQIVNRGYRAVRYQPTLCIVVNCPTVLEEVREAATREWGNLTPELHRQQLLDDAANPDYDWRSQQALELLRRYYPDSQARHLAEAMISAEAEGREVFFSGRVKKVAMLGDERVTFFPAGFDPRFLLVVDVDDVWGDTSTPVVAGETINLGIHSPAKLFGTVDPTGKRYRFAALWLVDPSKRFSWRSLPYLDE